MSKCRDKTDFTGIYKDVASFLRKFVKEHKGAINTTDALKLLEQEVAKLDPGKAEIIADVIESEFGFKTSYPFFNREVNLKALPPVYITTSPQQFIEVVDNLIVEDQDERAPGQAITDLVSNTKNSSLKIGDLGLDAFDSHYFSAIGRLNKKDMEKVYDLAAKHPTFESFFDYLKKKYPERLDPSMQTDETKKTTYEKFALRRRSLTTFYNVHSSLNSIKATNQKVLHYINLDHTKEIIDIEKDLAQAIVQHPYFQWRKVSSDGKPYNYREKRDESRTDATTFIDNSNATIEGVPVKDLTINFKLNSMVTVKAKKDGGWWAEDSFYNIDMAMIQDMEYRLSRFMHGTLSTPMTFVSATPGSTGNLILTYVLGAHVDKLFDKKKIIASLRHQNKEGYWDDEIAELEAIPAEQSINTWYKKKQDQHEQLLENLHIKVQGEEGGKLKPISKWDDTTIYFNAKALKLQQGLLREGLNNLESYLQNEVDAGNITEADVVDMLESAVDRPATPYGEKTITLTTHMASIISRHEWLKAVRGDSYLLVGDANPFHLSRRLKLNQSKGISTNILGDSNHLIYDQDRVDFYYHGEKIETMIDIPGVGVFNINDGASFISDHANLRRNQSMGTYPILPDEHMPKQHKTVVVEHTLKNGKSLGYIEKKHATFPAIPGLQIWEKDTYGKDDSGLIVDMVRDDLNDETMIFHRDEVIDEIGDLDAVKTATGIYDIRKKDKNGKFTSKPYKSFTLKEQSMKMVIMPHNKGNDTVYGFVQYLSSLLYDMEGESSYNRKKLKDFTNTMLNILLENSKLYINNLIHSHHSPAELRKAIKYLFDYKDDANDLFKDKLLSTDMVGVHHPDYLTQLRPVLLNTYIGNGAFQARSKSKILSGRGKTGSVGSNYILAPDMTNSVKEGGIIISASNQRVFDEVWNIMERSLSKDDLDAHKKAMYGESYSKVDILNGWLSVNEIFTLTYRSPILSIKAIEVRKIQSFTEDDGLAIYFHPKDVGLRLIADYDIDESGLMLINNEQAKSIKSFQNTKWYKNRPSSPDYSIFEKTTKRRAGSLQDIRDTVLDLMQGMHIQGQATNMRSVATALAHKFGEIEFTDGVVVKPKALNDIVIMDYAPLNSTLTINGVEKPMNTNNLREYLGDNNVEVIVNKDGTLLMKTTFEHESLIIINAATDHDNPKASGILTNVWATGSNINDWFVARMFNTDYQLTVPHLKALKKLKKEFSNSALRKLRTNKTGNKMSMRLLFDSLSKKSNISNMSIDELAIYVQDIMKVTKTIKTKDQTIEELVLGINAIQVKADIRGQQKNTPEEALVLLPHKMWEATLDETNSATTPLDYPKERNSIAHHEASEKLIQIIEQSKDITELQKAEGLKFAHNFTRKFYKEALVNLEKMTSEELESHYNMKRPEYDDVLFELVVRSSKELQGLINKYGAGVHKVATLGIVSGLNLMQNIEYLPPADILDSGVHTAYKTLWENFFFEQDVDGRYESTKFDKLDSYKQEGRFNVAKILLAKKEKEC